jgi:cell wall assembly regulator SMI1
MMKKYLFLMIAVLTACSTPEKKGNESVAGFIDEAMIKSSVEKISAAQPSADPLLLEKGVRHASSLWRAEDGTPAEFSEFVAANYISDPEKRKAVFLKISNYFESLGGNMNEITLDLRKVLDEAAGEIDEIDRMFGNYSVGAHVQTDFYNNKIAFAIALNFPYYTLAEKEELGGAWSREEWAMARLGDQFVSRVPAELNQAAGVAMGNAEMYIAEYNIHMGKLRTDEGKQLFPDDMILLSHWNLRDEIKSNYADSGNGPVKQEMIYKVMERIIRQEIPEKVINNPEYEWSPWSNKVTKDGTAVELAAEPDTRYSHVINIFNSERAIDPFVPGMNTAILRSFSGGMEISQEDAEVLFNEYLSSPQLKVLGEMISKRLGRDLRPYDIWYDGFKSRSSISESLLTSKTSALYPDPAAFRAAMPGMLVKLGWSPERARYLADKIVVDPARGSGHAWGAGMKGAVSHLRTRISDKGMDYKGYNIAVHEFGHNVEQTISLYDVDWYMLSGVPNTGFTEATAFLFQDRDLMLLGIKEDNPEKDKLQTLDAAWSLMEIMGVSMVEMKIWKWLYENPQATPAQLKEQTISIATEVWNKYFAPVMGVNDSPLLAIYSHMINGPLYLQNYAYGQIIQFQIEDHLKGKDFSDEIDRMYSLGRLTPQHWMNQAAGVKISAQPILRALDEALK